MPESASQYQSVYPQGFRVAGDPAKVTTKVTFQGNILKHWLLRFYIPPSADGNTTLALFCEQKASVGVAARLGAPPQCNQYSNQQGVTNQQYNAMPWQTRPGTFAELRAQDWCTRNGSGTIPIVSDQHSSSKGEWLYVKVLLDGSNIPHVAMCNFEVGVDKSAYTDWYNSTMWDSQGNPALTSASVPVGPCGDFTHTGGGSIPTPDPVDPGGSGNPFDGVFPPIAPTPDPDPPPVTPAPVEPDPVIPPEPTPDPTEPLIPEWYVDPKTGFPIFKIQGPIIYYATLVDGVAKGFGVEVV